MDTIPPGLGVLIDDIRRQARDLFDQGQLDEAGRDRFLRSQLGELFESASDIVQEMLWELCQMGGDAGRLEPTEEVVRDILETGGMNVAGFAYNREDKNKWRPGMKNRVIDKLYRHVYRRRYCQAVEATDQGTEEATGQGTGEATDQGTEEESESTDESDADNTDTASDTEDDSEDDSDDDSDDGQEYDRLSIPAEDVNVDDGDSMVINLSARSDVPKRIGLSKRIKAFFGHLLLCKTTRIRVME